MDVLGVLLMTLRGIRKRSLRLLAVVAFGGSVFQLGGCDPTVRASLLTGLETTTQALTNTLIQTFFQSLQDNATTGGTGAGGLTTV